MRLVYLSMAAHTDTKSLGLGRYRHAGPRYGQRGLLLTTGPKARFQTIAPLARRINRRIEFLGSRLHVQLLDVNYHCFFSGEMLSRPILEQPTVFVSQGSGCHLPHHERRVAWPKTPPWLGWGV
jgi:hypothetical protein